MNTRDTHEPATTAPVVMLPGQAAAPEGPCDLWGMYVMHHAFRRDLGRFAATVGDVPTSERARWAGLARRWDRFTTFLHEHHTKEDEILWPALRARVDAAADIAGADLLDAMESEHEVLDPLVARVSAGLELLARGGDSSDREGLAATLAETARTLDEHLAHEERDAVALIQHHLSSAEWQQLERAGLAAKPGPRDLLFMLPWIADGLGEADLGPLLSEGGAVVRMLLALGRRGYVRRERDLFGVEVRLPR
ncbi:hemerythrin domain-containing protein [Nocardioides sp. R-C-SC26]|uniref:hemerythrin domain-containing protein n=1 Tax=Nocardioides sp. R-C-SC26 TaxID=2870414 RepID=UPI001E2E0307|nr:hemerythrin domain-containing protein [Nocardioides sp. R-C-SC26]